MKGLELIKTVSGVLVSIGVGGIVSNVIRVTTPDSAGTIKKICIGIGSFVISSMIVDEATSYTEKKIDQTADKFRKQEVKSEI